jgi:hypothetical protein
VPQAQAATKEEISSRLPREVLAINHRLEVQQSSMDKIHSDLSTLMDMVAQLAISLGKRPNAGGTAPSVVPTSAAMTPPHSYHSTLSLIHEVSTLMNSASPTTARPLHFSNLYPRHLPHPEFPTATMRPKMLPLAGPSSSAP